MDDAEETMENKVKDITCIPTFEIYKNGKLDLKFHGADVDVLKNHVAELKNDETTGGKTANEEVNARDEDEKKDAKSSISKDEAVGTNSKKEISEERKTNEKLRAKSETDMKNSQVKSKLKSEEEDENLNEPTRKNSNTTPQRKSSLVKRIFQRFF